LIKNWKKAYNQKSPYDAIRNKSPALEDVLKMHVTQPFIVEKQNNENLLNLC
jgi:hypothetical protein